MLETSASRVQYLYSGQFTLSTQLLKPNYFNYRTEALYLLL